MWVGVPFCLATAMGLGALALDLPLSAAEVGDGLVPPAVAYYLLGKGGVAIIIIMVSAGVNWLTQYLNAIGTVGTVDQENP